MVGDWNSDISDNESVFCKHFKLFCDENSRLFSSKLLLPANTLTYLSERWDSTSWLDHCVSTSDGQYVIQIINVLYNSCTSDHISMCIEISLELKK